jgi:uncharacterized protein (TIGR03437 family)
MNLNAGSLFRLRPILISLILVAISISALTSASWRVQGQTDSKVTTVSAASFASVVAPDSIAAAFGVRLATSTEVASTRPLPTSLAGTSVRVNGELARLFFVSPNQINFLVPAGTSAGSASIVVTSGDGTVSTGSAQIAPVAPALFTANSAGQGALASLLLRAKANGQQSYEPLARYDGTDFVTKPIDFGEEGDQLFLILFLTGLRQAPPSGVRVSIGGVEYTPLFVGAQSGFDGLDQINLALPRNFGGRGRITLLVKAAGYNASNAAEFEIGSGAQSLGTMQISAPAQPVLAGDELEVSGAGFAANPRENNVQIVAEDGLTAKADVLAVSNTSIRIRIPFGAGTGQLKVSRGQIEASAAVNVRTSVSGFIERAVLQDGQITRLPIAGARVRLREHPEIGSVTDAEGSFVMPDMTPGNKVEFEILPPANGSLNFPTKKFPMRVRVGRDNQIPRGDEQTLINGATFPLLADSDPLNPEAYAQSNANATAAPPDQNLTLTYLEPGRTPANLPTGHFSTRIAQIAPFGQKLSPGVKLSFPNADAIPVGLQPRLFKFDQTDGSATLGQFIDIGAGTVTADGQRVETAANAITEGSYYFVSIARPTAAISGRVVEGDGRPVPRAIVQARGQSTFTDGFGGFVLNNVPVMKASGDRVRVEVSYQRPSGRVSRKDSNEVELTAGALVAVKPDIALDPETTNFPPVILAPTSLTLTAGVAQQFEFSVTDPDSSQPIQVSLPTGTAAAFTSLFSQTGGVYRLNLAPGANAAGGYTLNLQATDAAGAGAMQSIAVTVRAPSASPVAQAQSIVTPEDTPRAITLSGSDPGGRALSYAIVSGPSRGSLSGGAPNLAYTPAPNFNGVDSFTFKVSNGSAESLAATVYIGVSPVNDAPVLSAPVEVMANAGEPLNLIVTATDVDGDQALQFTATGLPPGATFAELGGSSRQLSWTPAFTQTGTYLVSVTVTDNGSPPRSDTKQMRLTIVARWARTSGPEGGKILSFLSAGPDLYAGALGGGVFRSTDNGRSWIELNDGLGDTFVHALAANGTTLLAGTENAGVFRSTDRGVTWRPSNQGIEHEYVQSLAVIGTTILAGTRGDGVFRSTDGGVSWRPSSQGLPDEAFISALATLDSTVFAASEFKGGVFRSTDNGASWAPVNNGLPPNASALSLAVSGARLYAGIERNDSIGGVFVTTNGGNNWSAINTGLPDGNYLIVRALAARDNLLFAGTEDEGVFRSTNQGQSWQPVNTGLPDLLNVRAIMFRDGATLIGTLGPGVFRSTNDGTNWAPANSGLTSPFVLSLAVSGADLFAGARGGGLFRSSDQGASWTPVNQGLTNPDVLSLLVIGDKLFAGTQDYVFRSMDRGASWTYLNEGMGEHSRVRALAAQDGMIFAGTESGGVFRLANNGNIWTAVNNGLTNKEIHALAANNQFIFAGTLGGGVFRSPDRGANWTPVSNGLPNPEVEALKVIGGTLFAATHRGVFRSSDNGQSWRSANLLPDSPLIIFAFEAAGANIIAATEEKGVYLSSDQGESWTEINTGLTNKFTQALATNGQAVFLGFPGGVSRLSGDAQSWTAASGGLPSPFINAVLSSGENLFAGTLGSGVFRSTNRGQSWNAVNAGVPPNANIQSLVANGATLWAATFGDGVIASDDRGSSWRAVNNGLTNKSVNKLFLSGATLYAGTDGGVFRSTNGGGGWTAINAGLTNLRAVSFTLTNGTLYTGTDGGGVFRLNPDGASWTQVNRGLTSQSVTALSASGGAIYAGTTGGGICISRDGGENWTPVNNALPTNLNVYAFALSGKKIYAGSIYGVFVTEDEGQNWKQVNAGLLNTFVTGLAVSGDQLFASTASGGVFVSRIP